MIIKLRREDNERKKMTSNLKPEIIEACARAAHEVNRAYCIYMNDNSQPSWDDAPEWQKSSARNGVEGAIKGNTPRQSHEGWLKEKRDTGWKYGPVKNPETKEHPCFVEYDELPEFQKLKDALFLVTVLAMHEALVNPPEMD